jgi:hypothetical protein
MVAGRSTPMTSPDKRLDEVYADLSKVVRNPYDFGLGRRIPEPLSSALEKALCTLAQIQTERLFAHEGDLSAELSQDADRPSSRSLPAECGMSGIRVSEFCKR